MLLLSKESQLIKPVVLENKTLNNNEHTTYQIKQQEYEDANHGTDEQRPRHCKHIHVGSKWSP